MARGSLLAGQEAGYEVIPRSLSEDAPDAPQSNDHLQYFYDEVPAAAEVDSDDYDLARRHHAGNVLGKLATLKAWSIVRTENGIQRAVGGTAKLLSKIRIGKFEPRLERFAPQVLAIGSAAVMLRTLGYNFGHPTEILSTAGSSGGHENIFHAKLAASITHVHESATHAVSNTESVEAAPIVSHAEHLHSRSNETVYGLYLQRGGSFSEMRSDQYALQKTGLLRVIYLEPGNDNKFYYQVKVGGKWVDDPRIVYNVMHRTGGVSTGTNPNPSPPPPGNNGGNNAGNGSAATAGNYVNSTYGTTKIIIHQDKKLFGGQEVNMAFINGGKLQGSKIVEVSLPPNLLSPWAHQQFDVTMPANALTYDGNASYWEMNQAARQQLHYVLLQQGINITVDPNDSTGRINDINISTARGGDHYNLQLPKGFDIISVSGDHRTMEIKTPRDGVISVHFQGKVYDPGHGYMWGRVMDQIHQTFNKLSHRRDSRDPIMTYTPSGSSSASPAPSPSPSSSPPSPSPSPGQPQRTTIVVPGRR
jgi:hypothetical protein